MKYKVGSVVNYRHPYSPDVVFTDEIEAAVKDETIITTKQGEEKKN